MPVGQPNERPKISKDRLQQLADHRGLTGKTVLIGIRGYRLDSMGQPGRNDFGIYDDAIAIVQRGNDGKAAKAWTFNGNTDPSDPAPGRARLIPGTYKYKPGIHGLSKPPNRRYPAFVQAGPVTVDRANGRREAGYFGINIHRGGNNGTSSLGCQTVPPPEWEEFRETLLASLAATGQTTFEYALFEEADLRQYLPTS